MSESFDAFRYVSYMRSRWLWIAASCATACVLSLAITLVLPREYTATARIVIEPPAGTDLRSAMAVSPIYLESLRTYEEFATSDSLFERALDRFSLHGAGSRPVESLKKHILRVELVRNTRILEISATLPDPRKSQALAEFVAQSTADLNRQLVAEGDRELVGGMEQEAAGARARLDQLDAAWSHLLSTEPVDQLRIAQENAGMLRSSIEEQAVDAEVQATEPNAPSNRRAAELRRQVQAIDAQIAAREKLLAERTARQDKLAADRKVAQDALSGIETRLREARGNAGYRGERLTIIDPGIVPERPSSPNLPLNLVAALLLGLVLPILYFTLDLAWQSQRASAPRPVYRTLAKTRNE